MTETWDGEIERVAAYLYRDAHDWHPEAVWSELDDTARTVYRKRADAVAAMLGFPYHAKLVHELARLCVCDHNPETTQGPERECPIHGELPDAVIRINMILRAAERYVMAGLCGDPDIREELATLIEAARTDRDPLAPVGEGGECYGFEEQIAQDAELVRTRATLVRVVRLLQEGCFHAPNGRLALYASDVLRAVAATPEGDTEK